ncbi:Myb-like DNA-binding domain containing protein [Trichomonas vaginalis G3]|uniref:Myb-like DNA-binding domain containing protein n=1 Tax=Trichomonas vaginalis (strain ATCC PRA-98 / G3) TaxID=412133 RepID=A2FCA2_TRIV3|nr:RNA polymerase II transcription regulator recruiting protein [Trichomonas vaginalis G3]EAX97465.1 Myb-like DNA-binding domain containing protein [Trichomonas vaginalis G3]KAI5496569.1 RNA polymerase II transcription regulator recruiting protein [Trichomonas vaginalis G3]|eukprot:XP_001310395.1 Myb-like DNA-binding domain containing protein [Trichomonas vaginalis G3]
MLKDAGFEKRLTKISKTKWTPEEDTLLRSAVEKYGTSNWTLIGNFVPGRTGKQCRERWTGQICPTINKESWTPQEDYLLFQYQNLYGNKWALIAQYLPNRTPIGIKNRWNWFCRNKEKYYVPKEKKPTIKFESIVLANDTLFGEEFEEFKRKLHSDMLYNSISYNDL